MLYKIVLRQLKSLSRGRNLVSPYITKIRYTILATKTTADSILAAMDDKISNSAKKLKLQFSDHLLRFEKNNFKSHLDE